MNVFRIILIFLFVLVTAGIVVTKPEIHKPAKIANPDFTLKSLEMPKIVTVKSDFPQETAPSQKEVIKKQPQVKKIVKTIVKYQDEPAKEVAVSQPKTQPVEVKVEPQKIVEKIVQQTELPIEEEFPVELTDSKREVVVLPKVEKTVDVVTKTVNTAPLTEKEEIIAWNKWRSDLQNKVMVDSKINAPVGTTFHFSCTVDKFGNISNINTWSENDYYTPTAKRVIKPVLSSYQNQPILRFPARTRRTITNVTGSFTMAYTSRFSTPADYSDYERIKR